MNFMSVFFMPIINAFHLGVYITHLSHPDSSLLTPDT